MITSLGFRNNIQHYRKKLGLTQSQLADSIGITKTALCDYERQKYQPNASKALLLCAALGCSFYDLFQFEYLWVDGVLVTQTQDPGPGAAG